MLNGKKFLAVIPARAGSKRLPGKNKMPLAGKPMISWTIEASLNSKYIDEILISTDDSDIADIAIDYDLRVPFMRPKELAEDETPTIRVLEHAIEKLNLEENNKFDFLVLLQPTSPLRGVDQIDEAIELLMDRKADALISISQSKESDLLVNYIDSKQWWIQSKPKVDLNERVYRINGAIYICHIKRMLEEGRIFLKDNVTALLINSEIALDIDTLQDFWLAEKIMCEKN